MKNKKFTAVYTCVGAAAAAAVAVAAVAVAAVGAVVGAVVGADVVVSLDLSGFSRYPCNFYCEQYIMVPTHIYLLNVYLHHFPSEV